MTQATTDTLPALVGTVRARIWAESIRGDYLAFLDRHITDRALSGRRECARQQSATWWIAHRSEMLREIWMREGHTYGHGDIEGSR